MSRGIIIVCLAIAAVAAGLARAIGINLPRFALFDKEFGMIMFFQAFVSYFSSFPARLLTERPERYEGDVDGILDARLLEEKRDANQGLVLLTTTVMSAMLILGHACCHDGEWTGVDGDDAWSVLREIVGMSGEVIWFIGCCIGQSTCLG